MCGLHLDKQIDFSLFAQGGCCISRCVAQEPRQTQICRVPTISRSQPVSTRHRGFKQKVIHNLSFFMIYFNVESKKKSLNPAGTFCLKLFQTDNQLISIFGSCNLLGNIFYSKFTAITFTQ